MKIRLIGYIIHFHKPLHWVLLNIAKNTREQIHLQIKRFQQQEQADKIPQRTQGSKLGN